MVEMDREILWDQYIELSQNTENGDISSRMRKYRDLSLVQLLGNLTLVIACDSNASNGEKVHDTHRNSLEETAVSALKVPTMEVLASGATPIVIANNLCVEMEPTGKRIINAMREELLRCGLLHTVQFTGSTEDNMLTLQTGLGVTVIGLATDSTLKLGRTQTGDTVCCVGVPQSGIVDHYSEKEPDIAKISTVLRLRELDYIHEILPIGSKGAAYEAGELASCVGRVFRAVESPPVDMETSAGSCTAVLVSLSGEDVEQLHAELDVPCFVIGTIEDR